MGFCPGVDLRSLRTAATTRPNARRLAGGTASILALLLALSTGALAQAPNPPASGISPESTQSAGQTPVAIEVDPRHKVTAVTAADAPNDHGDSILITWNLPAAAPEITGYAVLRLATGGDLTGATAALEGWKPGDPFPPAGWVVRATMPKGSESYRDGEVHPHDKQSYAVATMAGDRPLALVGNGTLVSPVVQWFHRAKGFLLLNLLVIAGAILWSVFQASRGKVFAIRKIAGLDAVEEAVGRATEMGRPILFVPGTQDLDNVQTVAGVTILGSISQMTAQYETRLDVPVSKSLVLSTARETVKESYTAAGRPDLYNDDVVHYVTDEQFGFVAAIDGIMVREQPSACFYFGAFFAESLILAETGNSIGAIQIAGTAQPTQLPFFVAACDYTLIGEELFAASAYLSKNPSLLGSLRGQDIGKALAMIFITIGTLTETIGRLAGTGSPFLAVSAFIKRFFATNF